MVIETIRSELERFRLDITHLSSNIVQSHPDYIEVKESARIAYNQLEFVRNELKVGPALHCLRSFQ